MRVAVSGAAGQMGRLVATAVSDAPDLELVAVFDPPASGNTVAGLTVTDDPVALGSATTVVEFTRPDVVLDNIARWRSMNLNVVVGTSGFDGARIERVRDVWGSGPPHCLVVPNFSIGAILMMRLAELAAPHFQAAEVIELHHDRKVDAPSGTSLTTAERIGSAMSQHRHVESRESVAGVRGGLVADVPVHSVRLPGLVAHQEVLLGSSGETLSIRHDTTSREAFIPGVLLAVRSVATMVEPVTIGLEHLLSTD